MVKQREFSCVEVGLGKACVREREREVISDN